MGRKAVDEELESQIPMIISMIKDNCSDKEIIEMLGISPSTWKRKKAQNTRIKNAIDEAINYKNEKVEEALFKCCTGYKYTEEVATKVKEEYESESGQKLVREDVKVVLVKKYRGPDVNAQKYWLNNKKKEKWKDDPHKVELGKKSLKIKEKLADKEDW